MTYVGPLPPFSERAPWWGGDLQTVRNALAGATGARLADAGERLWFAMPDGDRLAGELHVPAPDSGRPLAILVHGLAGSAESTYVVATASHLLACGFPVLRLNLRGAGPTRAHCRDGYHAGRSADLAMVLDGLPAEWRARKLVAVGYSLGGNMLLKYVGESGHATRLAAAATVSAPIDLAAASQRFRAPRNGLYQRWLLRFMKREALAPCIVLNEAERRAIVQARTVYEFDDGYVAPHHGFRDADDYYARCSAAGFLDGIAVPSLLLHADNDPWIPVAPYSKAACLGNPALTVAVTRGGGHVGFHGPRAAAGGSWHDAAIAAFFAAAGGDTRQSA